MLHLVLVRHGESIRNYLTDLAREGHPALLRRHMRECADEEAWPLTELGQKQARISGEFVRTHVGDYFEAGSVSPFIRARQTAEGLGLEIEWQVDERLRERLWGEYPLEGYPSEQYIADLHHCSEPDWRAPFPNSESIRDLEPEAASFLLDLPTSGSVIAVTHGGTIKAFERVIEGDPPHRALGNCGVLQYEIERGSASGWQGRVRWACPAFGDETFVNWHSFE